jgi:hypothetical protein
MSIPDPQHLAAEVVIDALKERPDLFIAMHYLGLIDATALVAPETTVLTQDALSLDPQADRVMVMADQIEPVAAPVRPLNQVVVDTARWRSKRTRSPQQSRSAFARWVDGEIAYHPNVLGWDDIKGNWPREE